MDASLQQTMSEMLECMQSIRNELISMKPKHEIAKVDVIVVTYNHRNYIKESLESILMQKTDFKVNIIIADDHSNDGTVDIIKKLEKKSKRSFTWLDHDVNHGITKNYERAFTACHSQYIAVMEGDDLWTDPYRLQKHIDFLEQHNECSMCFNRYVVKNYEKGTAYVQPDFDLRQYGYFRIYTGYELASCNFIGNFSTCVYRSVYIHQLPKELFTLKAYDWLVNLMMAKRGGIGCLWQVMNIYRIHEGGTWSSLKPRERSQNILDIIDQYDDFTEHEFTAGFDIYRNQLHYMIDLPIKHERFDVIKKPIKKVIILFVRIGHALLPPIFLQIIKWIVPLKMQNKVITMCGGIL